MKRKFVVILIVVLISLIAINLLTDFIFLQLGRNEETTTSDVTETITVAPSTEAILSSDTTDTTDRVSTISSAHSEAPSTRSSSSSEAMSAESTDLTETTRSTPRDTPASKITSTVPPTVPITVTTKITSPIAVKTTTTVTTDVTTGMASKITVTEKSSTVFSTLTTAPTSPPTMSLSSVTQIGAHTSDTIGPNEDCNTICIIRDRDIDITTTAITTSIKKDTTMYYTKAIASEFDYAVRDIETGTACVLTNMRIRINLQYVTNVSQTGEATLTVPAKAKPTGICGDEIIKMTLRWKEPVGNEDDDEKENRITFRYIRNDTSFFLDYISIDVHLDGNNFPHALQKRMRGETADRHLQLFSASVKDEMFVCRTDTAVNVGDQMDVVISDIRLIAFNECIQNCSVTDDDVVTTKMTLDVGMIVGATIIGIILLLSLTYLILYLIWRARSERLARSQDPANSAYREIVVLRRWRA